MFGIIREKLKGWKTIIWSRSLTIIWSRSLVVAGVVAGLVVPIIDAIDGTLIGALVPPKYQPFTPLIIAAIGVVNEWLRRITTGPVGGKGNAAPAANVKAGD